MPAGFSADGLINWWKPLGGRFHDETVPSAGESKTQKFEPSGAAAIQDFRFD